MKQRHITHPAGTFAACGTCRHEPRHYVATGRTASEGVAFCAVGERHQLECLCRRCTGWQPTMAAAERAWGLLGETLPLPLIHANNVRPMRSATKARARA